VKTRPYDIALLDLKMPGMDGLTLYREIKKLRSETVAIVVTAYAASSTAAEARAAGAWHVLPKPVDPHRLLNLVEEAVDQPLVMVVDDDQDLCANLWDLLRERGFRVAIAHNQEQVAELLGAQAFTVVLIDMKLARGHGTEVFDLVRKADPDARTVLITGYRSEMEQLVQKVLREGADAVCYKPFDVDGLLMTLKTLIGTPAKPTGRS
jgi:DNA-binding NtrC family response regulator